MNMIFENLCNVKDVIIKSLFSMGLNIAIGPGEDK